MKMKLTPELSYVLGCWKYMRTEAGIGIMGREELRTAFLAMALKARVARPNEVQWKEARVFFYHSANRVFMDEALARENEAFCHHNDYAAAFLAGLFDAVGETDQGKPFLTRWDKQDEIVLLRLNFKTLKYQKRLYITPVDVFLKFTANWRQVQKTDLARMLPEGESSSRDAWMLEQAVGKPIVEKTKRRSPRKYPQPPPKKD